MAVWANLKVAKDYYKNYEQVEIVVIIIVFEFYDREGFKIFVKTELRKGTKMFFFAALLALALSANLLITKLNWAKLLLILAAYLSLSPVAKVNFCLSLPAKSTKLSFECFIMTELFYKDLVTKFNVKIEWDLEEVAFILVSLVVLAAIPASINT